MESPSGITKAVGTVATATLLLASFTDKPPRPAGPFNVNCASTLPPLGTVSDATSPLAAPLAAVLVPDESSSETGTAVGSVVVVATVSPNADPVMVNGVGCDTGAIATALKLAESAPPGIVTELGIVTNVG